MPGGPGKELPTSQQWTRAFRGESVSFFPWGDDYKPGMANTLENTVEATTAVDATPEDVSPFEVYNWLGNVCEYVRGETTFIGNRCVMVSGSMHKVTRLYTRYRRHSVNDAVRSGIARSRLPLRERGAVAIIGQAERHDMQLELIAPCS